MMDYSFYFTYYSILQLSNILPIILFESSIILFFYHLLFSNMVGKGLTFNITKLMNVNWNSIRQG